MEFEKLSAPSLKDLFVKQIQGMILSGELAQGTALPPERELARQMQVSRAVVNGGLAEPELTAKEVDERIRETLALVGMEERMRHMPGQMSGGEQQRVAIARAVAHRPKVVFADEPTGALDTESGLRVMQLFRNLIEKEGVTIVMTTHDPNLMELGDVVYELEDGEIIDRQIRE